MKLKIELSRQGNFILAVLLIHFVFFGYISNVYEKSIGNRVIFLYQVLFNPISILSLFILIAIVFILGFREQFFEYAIKNSIWLIPVIIIESWIWFMLINSFHAEFLELLGTLFITYFVSFESYLTILILLGINILSAILGAYTKQWYREYITKIKEVEL